jgi:hypothetical protein
MYVLFSALIKKEIRMTEIKGAPKADTSEDRRRFLASCGKFAAVTPPAITFLLSTSLHSSAIARSGGRSDFGGHKSAGFGHREHDHDRDHDRDRD